MKRVIALPCRELVHRKILREGDKLPVDLSHSYLEEFENETRLESATVRTDDTI